MKTSCLKAFYQFFRAPQKSFAAENPNAKKGTSSGKIRRDRAYYTGHHIHL